MRDFLAPALEQHARQSLQTTRDVVCVLITRAFVFTLKVNEIFKKKGNTGVQVLSPLICDRCDDFFSVNDVRRMDEGSRANI